MFSKKLIALFFWVSLVFQVFAFFSAGTVFAVITPPSLPGNTLTIQSIIDSIFTVVWLLFAGFSIIAFMIAGFLFLMGRGEPEKVKNARDAVIWGVVGVVVALISVSIPSIVRLSLFGP